jgi:hypothetical protein
MPYSSGDSCLGCQRSEATPVHVERTLVEQSETFEPRLTLSIRYDGKCAGGSFK